MKTNSRLAGIMMLLLTAPAARALAPAASKAEPARQPVVALIAAVGDHIEIVRQRRMVGSNLGPYARKEVQLQTQALNYAALKGLNHAVADAEPDAKRVLVQWAMSDATAQALEDAPGSQREDIVLDALIADLRRMPARQGWDRIEAIVPAYVYGEVQGMSTKLSGVGIYVQPLANQNIEMPMSNPANDPLVNSDISISSDAAAADSRTVDPNTGKAGNSSTFMAPYVYFERVTIDARTLAVVARKHMFENTKYFDPNSTAIDVSQQMPFEQVMTKLDETVERAAYKSVRDVRVEVRTGKPMELPASAPLTSP